MDTAVEQADAFLAFVAMIAFASSSLFRFHLKSLLCKKRRMHAPLSLMRVKSQEKERSQRRCLQRGM